MAQVPLTHLRLPQAHLSSKGPHCGQGRNEVRWRPGQEATLATRVRNWCLSEANVLYWRNYLWHCWEFSAPPAVIRRPGNCALLPLPRYAPDCGMSETMRPDPPCSCRFSELRWQEMLLLSPSSVASFLCFTWTDNSHHTVKTSFQDLSLAEPAHQRDSVSLHAAAVNVTPPETSWTDGDLNLWL